ncbi:hypothetical protein CYMTET_36379 [Cymbomonas tetramitiformis]|uniref:Uncharacterized protein n=1 Tax=Cymbomonas tetramitiformis TaxID=36881 RepID=A0AAE0F717_9CHLO|nr:hypothetical protein CYMTET_36379 [Cymbomonas tetramitiformis]
MSESQAYSFKRSDRLPRNGSGPPTLPSVFFSDISPRSQNKGKSFQTQRVRGGDRISSDTVSGQVLGHAAEGSEYQGHKRYADNVEAIQCKLSGFNTSSFPRKDEFTRTCSLRQYEENMKMAASQGGRRKLQEATKTNLPYRVKGDLHDVEKGYPMKEALNSAAGSMQYIPRETGSGIPLTYTRSTSALIPRAGLSVYSMPGFNPVTNRMAARPARLPALSERSLSPLKQMQGYSTASVGEVLNHDSHPEIKPVTNPWMTSSKSIGVNVADAPLVKPTCGHRTFFLDVFSKNCTMKQTSITPFLAIQRTGA